MERKSIAKQKNETNEKNENLSWREQKILEKNVVSMNWDENKIIIRWNNETDTIYNKMKNKFTESEWVINGKKLVNPTFVFARNIVNTPE